MKENSLRAIIEEALENEVEALQQEAEEAKPAIKFSPSIMASRCTRLVPPLYNILRRIYYKVIAKEYRPPHMLYFSRQEKSFAVSTVDFILKCKDIDSIAGFFSDDESHRVLKEYFRKRILCVFNDAIPSGKLFTADDLERQKQQFKFYVENYRQVTPSIGDLGGIKLMSPLFIATVFTEYYGLKHCRNVNENPTIVDCGAYIGDSTLMFNKIYDNDKVVAVEPSPPNFHTLRKNMELNNVSNVVLLNMAVGAEEGYGDILSDKIRADARLIKSGGKVRISTIDKLVGELNLERVDVIKMDIEGSELDALSGAQKTITEFRPVLLVSVYHHGEDILEIPKLIKELAPGYQMKLRHLDPFLPISEYILICEYPRP